MDAVSSGRYLTRKQVCTLLGNASAMTLHRYRHGYTDKGGKFHPPLPDFPKPVAIGPHPMWSETELCDWLQSRPRLAA